jgi:signal transduction histidine kinase
VDAAIEAEWSRWLLDRNRRAARTVLLLVGFFYPLFGVLDYMVARPHIHILYPSRALVTLITIAMFVATRRPIFERHAARLTQAYMLSVGAGIGVMVFVLGGYSSVYYAGLNLVMITAGLLFMWPARIALPFHVAIVMMFLVPNAFIASGAQVSDAVTNMFFLVTTATVVSAAQVFAFRGAYEQVVNQIKLEAATASLARAHDELKRLDRFKSHFFANITHELKTPLAMILSPVEMMIDGDMGTFTEAQRATLRTVFRNGVKLLRLIEDLLDLSRLEESRLRLRVDEHDLVAFLRALVAQVLALTQRKSIEVTFESDAETVPTWCDLDRLERVFINVLSNAAKFTPAGGHITVRVAHDDEHAVVTVQDDGPGFDPAMAERLFERFFQVEMAGSRRYGGAGIGLALARELVQLHGGEIHASSAPGEGALFTVRLPRDREHFRDDALDQRGGSRDLPEGQRESDRSVQDWVVQVAARPEFRLLDVAEVTERRVVERDPGERAHARTVLVIEDTPDVIRLLHAVLRHHFRVLATTHALQGLEVAQRELPDLVITDLMMPDVDGLEFIRRFRADPRFKHTPVLMLTARGDLEDRLKGIETGASAYMTKPFAPRELLSTVRSLLQLQDATADMVLTQQMDSLEVVAGGMAHEINNPLNYISNALARIESDVKEIDRLAREATPDAAAKLERIEKLKVRVERMFQTARSGVGRIRETVDVMRRYSREGYSRLTRAHDVFEAVRDVLRVVVPAIGREVIVETKFQGDGIAECVPEELHQVFANLIQNAIEAVDDQTGRVTIEGEGSGDVVTLTVRDNGHGIPKEDLARVFTPFFTKKPAGKGMGMGLTITWRVLHSLGGTIAVRSEEGAGAEFVVRIPRSQATGRNTDRPGPLLEGTPPPPPLASSVAPISA